VPNALDFHRFGAAHSKLRGTRALRTRTFTDSMWLVGEMSTSYEHYRAQAELCRGMAASAPNEKVAAEWQMLANLWRSMASSRMVAAETSLDLMDDALLPQEGTASPGAHRSPRAF
jgi:hypothetical protein